MTQPPGPPPQGGFGPPPPNGPPPGGQWQPPAGPPAQGSYGYPQSPEQPTLIPGQQAPYGQQPYGAPGGYPPPPPGGPSSGSGGKIAVIIAGAVALLALLAGGVYLAVGGHDGKNPVVAEPSASADPTAGTDTGGSSGGTTQPTDDPAADPTSDPFDTSGGGSGDAPAGDDFRGQWTSDGKVLTIGDKLEFGEHAGKFNLNWIELGGGKGLCLGYGEMQGHDLHLTVTCDGKDVSATARKISSGQGVTLSWDDGATDDLTYEGTIG